MKEFIDAMELKPVKITAHVIEDKNAGLFTAFMKGKGGPIVSASTIEEVHKKFEEALDLGCAVKNLVTFGEAIREKSQEAKEKFAERKNNKDNTIQFVTLVA